MLLSMKEGEAQCVFPDNWLQVNSYISVFIHKFYLLDQHELADLVVYLLKKC